MADLMNTREFNFLELDGDHDLFGDGSVLVLSTPGHTIGHQSLKVKLPQTGTVIVSQDAIWMQENLDGYPAGLNFSVQAYTNSVQRLKQMRDLEGAQIFMAHDGDQFKAKGDRWYK
jgi:glyoxylase-like metal-dependent hydrolase (beta-lactamase superfamily II)